MVTRVTQTMNLAFLCSATGGPGNEGWHPLKPEEVPEWITGDPDLLLKLAYGDMVRYSDGVWYRAVKLPLPSAENEAPANEG